MSRNIMDKSKTGYNLSKMGLAESVRPSPLAKLQAQKQIKALDARKTRVIYDEDDIENLKSAESKRRSRKKDRKSKKLEKKDDNEPGPPKDDYEPSTSKKHGI